MWNFPRGFSIIHYPWILPKKIKLGVEYYYFFFAVFVPLFFMLFCGGWFFFSFLVFRVGGKNWKNVGHINNLSVRVNFNFVVVVIFFLCCCLAFEFIDGMTVPCDAFFLAHSSFCCYVTLIRKNKKKHCFHLPFSNLRSSS